MSKYVIRYEVCNPLGNGGQTVAIFKTVKEAREYRGKQDLNIFKSIYTISQSGKRLRISSEFVY